MNDVEKIAIEVALFYNSLMNNGLDSFVASQLTSTFLATRMQFGRFPEDSQIIPIMEQLKDEPKQ